MKVVVNRCYGGFSLSFKAIKMFLKLKGKKCYFYKWDLLGDKLWHRLDNIDNIIDNNTLEICVLTKDCGKIIKEIPNRYYFNDRKISRTDKQLIKIIEEIGEEANGQFSYLEIVEIPDDIEWEITDYDGYETVEEKHRSW